MKSYRFIAFAILLLILTTASMATPCGADPNDVALLQTTQAATQNSIIGDWSGVLEVTGVKLNLVVHIGVLGNVLGATLDSPDQGALGLVIDAISFKDNILTFELRSISGAYEGKLSGDGNQFDGNWSQQGLSLPLKLSRVKSGETGSTLKLQRVDVDGHGINLLIGGTGKTTVVLEGGFGAGIASWSTVQKEIAEFARVVSYDRAGLGQSDPGPKPRTGKQIASELHAALEKAGLKPPYVLVGHSLGGIYVRIFADLYPKEVSGMVLIDPSQEAFEEWLRANQAEKLKNQQEQMAKGPEGPKAEWDALPATYTQVRNTKLPAIPVVLLSATEDEGMPEVARKTWIEKHKEWVATIPGGKHIIAEKSGHFIQVAQPKLVIDAIKEVVPK